MLRHQLSMLLFHCLVFLLHSFVVGLNLSLVTSRAVTFLEFRMLFDQGFVHLDNGSVLRPQLGVLAFVPIENLLLASVLPQRILQAFMLVYHRLMGLFHLRVLLRQSLVFRGQFFVKTGATAGGNTVGVSGRVTGRLTTCGVGLSDPSVLRCSHADATGGRGSRGWRSEADPKCPACALHPDTRPKPWGPGSWRLYNTAKDPGETTEISKQHPEILKELTEAWGQYAKDLGVVLSN
jgi:hypothetical protein